jgi:hypothetical protein
MLQVVHTSRVLTPRILMFPGLAFKFVVLTRNFVRRRLGNLGIQAGVKYIEKGARNFWLENTRTD